MIIIVLFSEDWMKLHELPANDRVNRKKDYYLKMSFFFQRHIRWCKTLKINCLRKELNRMPLSMAFTKFFWQYIQSKLSVMRSNFTPSFTITDGGQRRPKFHFIHLSVIITTKLLTTIFLAGTTDVFMLANQDNCLMKRCNLSYATYQHLPLSLF